MCCKTIDIWYAHHWHIAFCKTNSISVYLSFASTSRLLLYIYIFLCAVHSRLSKNNIHEFVWFDFCHAILQPDRSRLSTVYCPENISFLCTSGTNKARNIYVYIFQWINEYCVYGIVHCRRTTEHTNTNTFYRLCNVSHSFSVFLYPFLFHAVCLLFGQIVVCW